MRETGREKSHLVKQGGSACQPWARNDRRKWGWERETELGSKICWTGGRLAVGVREGWAVGGEGGKAWALEKDQLRTRSVMGSVLGTFLPNGCSSLILPCSLPAWVAVAPLVGHGPEPTHSPTSL